MSKDEMQVSTFKMPKHIHVELKIMAARKGLKMQDLLAQILEKAIKEDSNL